MQPQSTIKRRIIISVVLFVVTIVIVSIFSYITTQKSTHANEELQIANLNDFTNGKPTNKTVTDYIKHSLYLIVNRNSESPVATNSVKDILVRQGSFSQTYNAEKDVHNVTMLVDSESLKQSYRLSYQWNNEPENRDNLDQYGTMATCPTKEESKYSNFTCISLLSEEESAEPEDPILEFLPYSDSNYSVTYSPDAKKTLNVTIYTSAADERMDPNAAVASYEQAVRDWIVSVGLDPNAYTINYDVIHASLY